MNEHTDDTEPIEIDEQADSTLVVRVESVEQARDRMMDAAQAIDRGDTPEERHGVSLPTQDRLNRLLSESAIELLRTIARENPQSINETARTADRDVHIVHDTLTELERLGLVRFEAEGNAKRPVVWYDEIDVEIPITV